MRTPECRELNYDQVMDAIMRGDLRELELIAADHQDFPSGRDSFINRTWLTNAIDCGPAEVVRWMLAQGAPVNFEDEEGYPALHSAIDRELPGRLEVLEILCAAGADVNAHGVNDWTPLHLAAVRNDVGAVRILLRHGARTDERTRIDDYATPLEEARRVLGRDTEAIRLLASQSG